MTSRDLLEINEREGEMKGGKEEREAVKGVGRVRGLID